MKEGDKLSNKAKKLFKTKDEQLAYMKGYLDSMQNTNNLCKSKDKLGDDFTKFLESEGYTVIDCEEYEK